MNDAKRKALAAAGFVCGDAEDFLGLTDGERKLVDLRACGQPSRSWRRKQAKLTQKKPPLDCTRRSHESPGWRRAPRMLRSTKCSTGCLLLAKHEGCLTND